MAADRPGDILSTLVAPRPHDFTTRPVVMGMNGMVTSGHYLASRIGLHILESGGNAVDAAAAMGFALSVLEPHLYGIGGEGPLLIYLAGGRRVVSLSGQGPAPKRATIEWFKGSGFDVIPGERAARRHSPGCDVDMDHRVDTFWDDAVVGCSRTCH